MKNMQYFIIFIFFIKKSFASSVLFDEATINTALVKELSQNPFAMKRETIIHERKRKDNKTTEQILLISTPWNMQDLKKPKILILFLDGHPISMNRIESSALMGLGLGDVILVGTPSSNRYYDYGLDEKGGPEFTSYLANQLVPFLEKTYGSFSTKVIVGASLGGISVIETLSLFPDSFDAYVAISPSLWHNYKYYESKFYELFKNNQKKLQQKCLVLSGGEDEPSITENTRHFHQLLNGLDLPKTFHYSYQRFENLDHTESIVSGYSLISANIFDIEAIFNEAELMNLSKKQFDKKVDQFRKNKTCIGEFSPITLMQIAKKYGNVLVKEKRFKEVFELYNEIKGETPKFRRGLYSKDSFIMLAWKDLALEQQKNIAKDYIDYYQWGLKGSAAILAHFVQEKNQELIDFIDTK